MDIDFVVKLLEGYDIPIRSVKPCTTLDDGEIEVTEIVFVKVATFAVGMTVVLEIDDVRKSFPERKFIEDVIDDLNTARGYIPATGNNHETN